MINNEHRHAHGSMIPNLFFLLQTIVVLLILLILIQISDMLNFSGVFILISCAVAVAFLMYFLVRRKRVIQRQVWYTDEDKKD